jgi:hypothetical protein
VACIFEEVASSFVEDNIHYPSVEVDSNPVYPRSIHHLAAGILEHPSSAYPGEG